MTAWSPAGFIGSIIGLARRVNGWPGGVQPPERWGRYETEYPHLFDLEGLEVLEKSLTLEFSDEDELWSVLSAPPGPLARGSAMRQSAVGKCVTRSPRSRRATGTRRRGG